MLLGLSGQTPLRTRVCRLCGPVGQVGEGMRPKAIISGSQAARCNRFWAGRRGEAPLRAARPGPGRGLRCRRCGRVPALCSGAPTEPVRQAGLAVLSPGGLLPPEHRRGGEWPSAAPVSPRLPSSCFQMFRPWSQAACEFPMAGVW